MALVVFAVVVSQIDVVVIGSGVIGLTTAIRLSERGASVHVVADRQPGETTSAAATATCGPSFASLDSRVGQWELVTLDVFERAFALDVGVRPARGMLGLRRDIATPTLPSQFDVRIAAAAERPMGFSAGFLMTVPLIDMPRYLAHLERLLNDRGVVIEARHLSSITSLSDRAPVIVNCSGSGARELASDETLVPTRGQQLVVENPGIDSWFGEVAFGESLWSSWFPHGDHVLLGGSSHPGDERLDADPQIADEILRRCVALEPRFASARVLGHRVGLRPARPEVRLEVERVSEATIVHNYGHGGLGVTLCWGCATEAADLALGAA